MINFEDWCNCSEYQTNGHPLHLLYSDPDRLAVGIAAIASIVPNHYTAEQHISNILRRLGKPEAAKFLESKLPTSKAIRSGDLGEILASEIIESQSPYQVPIKRLRWKDHRNMAMRGDDVIGILQDFQTSTLRFLKVEAKSRATLGADVIAEARATIDKDGGMPSAHALSFIADRLSELANEELADAIIDAQLRYGIDPASVRHLIFVLSGNDPQEQLSKSLQAYVGGIAQWFVGLHIAGQATFVAAVYESVIANAKP